MLIKILYYNKLFKSKSKIKINKNRKNRYNEKKTYIFIILVYGKNYQKIFNH